MKNFKRVLFIIIIIIMVNHMPSLSQQISGYKKALEYIARQNPHKNIVVSDTIVNLSFHDFSEEISKMWRKNNNVVFDLLDSVDHAQETQKFVVNEFKNVQFVGKGPSHIVYFSNFYSNMVIGEILIQKNKKHGLTHEAQTGFNESTQYLFVFDKKNSLKRVFKIKKAYD